MLITSSRKPSAKTRILCKYLANFFNCEYINRGKMGMWEVLDLSQDEPILIVGEYHGNPGSLAFYDAEGTCLLSIYVSVSKLGNVESKLKKIEPAVIGTGELADVVSNILSLEQVQEGPCKRCVMIDEGRMDFIDSGNTLFKLLIKSFRSFL